MTVKELKKLLEDVDDELELVGYHYKNQWTPTMQRTRPLKTRTQG